jgi:gamma-glutamyltranspeptidase / glutathione hydrolase
MMRLDTVGTDGRQTMNRGPRRQLRLALTTLFLLSACGRNETDQRTLENPSLSNPNRAGLSDLIGGSAPFAAASADESLAAEVGKAILENGGNATDAAVAMYFAMAVTLPSAASLGASGACIVHDSKTMAGEAFVFAPIPAPGAINGVSFIVPSGVRAVTLMHIRHGKMHWEAAIAPAERMARAGVPVSRALSRDLKAAGGSFGGDREVRRIFTAGAGTPIGEGDNWSQTDLAATLGVIRQRGGGDFFGGNLARLMSDQVTSMGGSLPLETLRNTVPKSGPPDSVNDGGYRVYVAPAPMAGSSALAGWQGQAAPAGGVPTNSDGIAGLAAVDSKGGAAACSMSMGQLFGARMIVPGTGILLAAPTANSTAVSPLVIGNPNNGEFRFAGAGGGSPNAAYATGWVARAVMRGSTVGAALQAHGGQGGYVNAIACPGGIRASGSTCSSGIDPSGSGLALVVTVR